MNISEFLENFLANFFTSGQSNLTAVQIQGAVVDAGYDPAELDNVNWNEVYENACAHPGVPDAYKGALQNHQAPTVHTVVQEVQTINNTEVFNTNIFDNSTDIDQSINVGGDFAPTGPFDFNPIAGDDGAAVAGGNQTGVVTGDGSNAAGGNQQGVAVGENATASGTGDANNASGGEGLINTGTNLGNQNTGDNAAQVGGTSVDLGFGGGFVREPVLTRELSEGGEGGPGGHDGPGFPGLGDDAPDININTGSGNQSNEGDDFHYQHVETNNSPGAETYVEEGDGDQNTQADDNLEGRDFIPAV